MALAQKKYWPTAYTAPTVGDVKTAIQNIPKPVINVTPVNKLAQQNTPAPTPFSWWTPNLQQFPKSLPMTNPQAPTQVSQTWPNSFGTYKTPAPFQTQYLEAGKRIDAQKALQETKTPEQKKPKERYVAMDRRAELAQQQRKEVPEIAKLSDDEIVEKFTTQFPQFQEFFKLPEEEQDANKQIVEAIRRDYPEAQGMTDEQLLQQWNQHQELVWVDPTAPWQQQSNFDWAVKWMPGQTTDTNAFWIPKIPRIDPTMTRDKQKDAGSPNVGKMIANIPSSAVNVAWDIGNMVLDPVDTVKWIVKILSGAWVNAGKWVLKLFADDDEVENRLAVGIDRMKRKWGVMGKIASLLESNEDIADAVGTALQDRYWSADAFAKTLTEDPLAVASDIASIIEGGGTLLKWWGKATGASKLAKLWDEIAQIGNASDPYALAMVSWAKGVEKASDAITTPSKAEWVSMTDRLVSSRNGLDAETVRLMKDNADLIKQLDEWTLSKEALQERVVKIIEDVTDEKSDVGKMYQEAYKSKTTFDAKEVIDDVVNTLKQQWVKFSEDGTKIVWFDITNTWLANLTTEAKTALKSRFDDVIDTLQGKDTLSVEELHNIRKSLNKTTYQDGFQTKKAPGIDKVVSGINQKLKTVPWFKTTDKVFSEVTTELAQVKKTLTTTDAEGKLQMKWTIKSLMGETGRKKLEVIERYYPEFRRNIEAIIAYDDYTKTRTSKKVWLYNKPVSWGTGWAVWFAIWWPVWAILWAIAGTMLHAFATDPKRFKNWVVKKMGNKVAQKIAKGQALSRAEKARMEFEAEKIVAKPQLALEYKPDLKTEKTQAVDTQWVVRWQPGSQTLQKQAIEWGKIVTKTEINASPIRVPWKKWPYPEKVVEKWQENVKQPVSKMKQEAQQKKQEILDRKKERENEWVAKKEAFEKAPWEVIEDIKQFKRWMITPDGKITETGFNRSRPFYLVEWDSRFSYRYEGKAKRTAQVPQVAKKAEVDEMPWNKKETVPQVAKETVSPDEIEAQKWIQEQIGKDMGSEFTENRDIIDRILRIENEEKSLWKVGRNKVIDRNYRKEQELKFTTKKERLIEAIAERNNLSPSEAKDRYDRELNRARDTGERYQARQEYSRAPESVQKTHLSPEEAWARIRKYFSDEEVPVIFQDKITTPRGQDAYGKYHEWAITMIKYPKLTTPDHEAFHAYFDLFTTKNRQKQVLKTVKKQQNIKDNIEAEEWLADNFAEFVAKRETFTWAVKSFFWDVRSGIKKVFGKEDAVRRLYRDIINKERVWVAKTTIKLPKFQTKENELVALHNLSIEKLKKITELWWAPMPSIAITEKWIPFEDFGDITLVWDRRLVTSQWTKIYSADAYTPRVPKPVEFMKKEKRVKDRVKKIAEEMWEKEWNVEAFLTNDWYNRDHMLERDPRREKYVDEIQELTVRKLFKWFSWSGNRNYKDYNMENIVKDMKQQWKGNEAQIFAWNLHQIMGKASSRLDIPKVKKVKFWKKEDFDKLYDKAGEEYMTALEQLDETKFANNIWSDLSEAWSSSPEATKNKLNSRWYNVTTEQIKKIHDIVKRALELPKSYIEAKIERWVDLDEFWYVLAPVEQVEDIKKILAGTRIKGRVIGYKEWESRTKKIQEIQNKYWNIFFGIAGFVIPAQNLLSLFGWSEE